MLTNMNEPIVLTVVVQAFSMPWNDWVSLKKKTLEHPKACLFKTIDYLIKLKTYKANDFPIVYMDESGFEQYTLRPYGYAPIGERCLATYNWQAKKRTNVIGALYKNTLFAIDYFEQNINTDCVYDWCKNKLIPDLKRKCVIVMDNASFHKAKRIQKLLNRYGHRLLFLPPYSPQLNPIEKKWAQVKAIRRKLLENDLPKLFNQVACTNFILV